MMIFQHQQQVDENMSNLTSTTGSGEASGSSIGNKINNYTNNNNNDQLPYFTSSSSQQQQPPPSKKKRNLPGNPDPEAEVVALSPTTLMARNRFICEICNKGFQRDQNLQLHRRGHNLPWKLKQRPKNEVVRRKVYVCPEVGCVHHDPARALGDLTGIKKHFSRKHGEKKWKCDKCSKRYAVQSDWKAHSKTCGTREYRCDCGTIFSRRDSFITHRAFCDALAEESARSAALATQPPLSQNLPLPLPPLQLPLPPLQLPLSQQMPPSLLLSHSHHSHSLSPFSLLKKEQPLVSNNTNLRQDLPPWLGPPPPLFDNNNNNSNNNNSGILQDFNHLPPNPNPNAIATTSTTTTSAAAAAFNLQAPSAHMSATALLQKAAQMGATMSTTTNKPDDHHHHDLNNLHESSSAPVMMMSSLHSAAASDSNSLGGAYSFGGIFNKKMLPLSDHHHHHHHHQDQTSTSSSNTATTTTATTNNGDQGLTRDFLGLRAFSHSDILSLAGLGNTINISRDHQNNQPHHKPW